MIGLWFVWWMVSASGRPRRSLQLQRQRIAACRGTGLTCYDLGFALRAGQNKVVMLRLSVDQPAFANATNAVRAFDVNGNTVVDQNVGNGFVFRHL